MRFVIISVIRVCCFRKKGNNAVTVFVVRLRVDLPTKHTKVTKEKAPVSRNFRVFSRMPCRSLGEGRCLVGRRLFPRRLERAVLRWSVADEGGEFHFPCDQVWRFEFSFEH